MEQKELDELLEGFALPFARLVWTAEETGVAQSTLLAADKLARLTGRLDIGSFSERDVTLLWRAGLLNADLIASTSLIGLGGIHLLGQASGRYWFCDLRRPEGDLVGSAGSYRRLPDRMKLFFHPARLVTMVHLNRALRCNFSPMQILHGEWGYQTLVEHHVAGFDRWWCSESAARRIVAWNVHPRLCAATEPVSREIVFSSIRTSGRESVEEMRERIESYRSELNVVINSVGLRPLEDVRREICQIAETLDSNDDLHAVIRMMTRSARERVRGRIGGAVQLLALAEGLRRAVESAYEVELPEEDQMGFGEYPDENKIALLGTKRLQDSGVAARNHFLKLLGLDYSVRARCYVEGATELHALEYLLSGFPRVLVIDLAGQFVERGGRGLAFRRSLEADLKANVFSFVVLDQDRRDNINVLRKAVEDDAICGEVLMNDPDFEFANFLPDELGEVVFEYLESMGVEISEPGERASLFESLRECRSGRELERCVERRANVVVKGREWGRLLARHAWTSVRRDGEERPIVRFIESIMRAATVPYRYTRDRMRVCPESGRLVERDGGPDS